MKYLRVGIFAAMLLGIASAGFAAGPYNAGQGYVCQTTSVTSATTPVSILAPARMTTWTIHTRSGAAVSALVFPYTGSVPGSAPSGVMEVAAGAIWNDQVACSDPTCKFAIGEGWAAVLASGTTAVTVDTCYR